MRKWKDTGKVLKQKPNPVRFRFGKDHSGWVTWMEKRWGEGERVSQTTEHSDLEEIKNPHSSVGKESACSAGDLGSILGSGRSPGEGNGYQTPVFLLREFCGHTMGLQRVGHNWATFTHLVMMCVFIVNLGFVYQNDITILLKHVKVKVAQSCPTLCNSMDYTVHEILWARILEWVTFPFSRGSSQPRDWTQVSWIAGGLFTGWATREAQKYRSG